MLLEQEDILTQLGTSEEAAKVRAKMQSASLVSDMASFKVFTIIFPCVWLNDLQQEECCGNRVSLTESETIELGFCELIFSGK